ncbi:MAG: DUF6526 family protein [Vicinamibacterales bacterium]
MSDAQNFKNHVRRLPTSVTVLYLILLFNLVWSGYRAATAFSIDTLATLLVAIALPWIGVVSRQQTLTVQNRVIRLEERLRYAALLPAAVAARAATLPIEQLVALRFASDEELPALVNDVLAGQLTEPAAIKQRVAQWRADYLRA